ncbi:MAG: class I SAM-dependent methyltransferase family protein [Conexivisphaerales archaeon]
MKLIREMLSGILSQDELEKVAGGFDLIGNIAILKLPEEMEPVKKKVVAELLMDRIPRLKSVWNQTSPFEGPYRLRGLEHLAGSSDTRTEYREHGMRLIVDVARAYFSPRLSEERLRVARQVRENEVIFNMFSGVGSYSILIAKMVKNVKVYSSEINEEAYNLMVENIALNRVSGNVIPMLGDCREHARNFRSAFNRVIMSLPEESSNYLPAAIETASKGAVIHFYAMAKGEKKKVVQEEFERVRSRFDSLKMLAGRVVTEAGPRVYEVVLDLLRE